VDGLDAVSKVIAASQEGRSIDIIFLDYIMPVMDGPTTVRKLRDMGYTGLVIGVTGQVMRVDIEAFSSQGADKVLLKPVDFFQFEEVFDMYYENLPSALQGDSCNPLQTQTQTQEMKTADRMLKKHCRLMSLLRILLWIICPCITCHHTLSPIPRPLPGSPP